MAAADVRDAFVGRSWSETGLVLVLGLIGAPFLVGAAGFLQGLGLGAVAYVLVGVLLVTEAAHRRSGLIACWLVSMPFLAVMQTSCVGARGFCAPTPLEDALPGALAGSFVLGSIGYGAVLLAARRHDDPSIWMPLGYIIGSIILGYLLLIALSAVGIYV